MFTALIEFTQQFWDLNVSSPCFPRILPLENVTALKVAISLNKPIFALVSETNGWSSVLHNQHLEPSLSSRMRKNYVQIWVEISANIHS